MQAVCLALTLKICNSYPPYRPTVACLLFVCVVNGAGVGRATYLCLDSTKNVNKKLGYKLKTALSTACNSGRSLSWKVQENNKGILI